MDEEKEERKVTMYGIWVVDGHAEPIALFEFAEHAEDWARENYFGNWLLREIEIPFLPIWTGITDEEWEQIEKDAEEMHKKLCPLPKADD